jgi:hypothetical protein
MDFLLQRPLMHHDADDMLDDDTVMHPCIEGSSAEQDDDRNGASN